MDSREEVQRFWGAEFTKSYAEPTERSEFLYEFIKDIIPKTARLFELGSNCGRNVAYLRGKGYKVDGCDINIQAIIYAKERFGLTLIHGKVEDVIKIVQPDCFYTMAVLEHIHPDSEWIFEEMAKAKYIVTVEDELHDTEHHCPRNYGKIFSKTHTELKTHKFPDSEILDPSFVARLFQLK